VNYPMSEEDRSIQAKARKFVDEELIPWEVEAEMNRGEIPADARKRHHDMAIELGLYSMNMPKELGGSGWTTFQQALVSERRWAVTNHGTPSARSPVRAPLHRM